MLGFDGVPEAGEYARVVENERRARQLASERSNRLKTEALARRSGRKISLEDVFRLAQEGAVKELNLVLKGDVSGSVEAVEDEIAKLPQDEVSVNIIHRGVGGINESDVMLAAASDAVILAFNVRPVGDARARRRARGHRDPQLLGDLPRDRRAARGDAGHARARGGRGRRSARPRCARPSARRASARSPAASSRRASVTRGSKVRLVRDGTVINETTIASLRRFNDDVREVAPGFECGIVLTNFQDVKDGDVLEAYETRKVERELGLTRSATGRRWPAASACAASTRRSARSSPTRSRRSWRTRASAS